MNKPVGTNSSNLLLSLEQDPIMVLSDWFIQSY